MKYSTFCLPALGLTVAHAAAVAKGGAAATGGGAAAAAGGGACAKYYIVNTRGTSEPQMQSIAFRGCNSQIMSKMPGGTEYATVYPAGFTQQSGGGTADIVRYVTQMSAANPTACFVLEGYSQGAMATIDALPKLTAKANVIKAIMVVGSPAHAKGGLETFKAPNVAMWQSKILDICAKGDPVCGTPTADGPVGLGHLAYPMSPATQTEMANFAIKALQSGAAPSAGGAAGGAGACAAPTQQGAGAAGAAGAGAAAAAAKKASSGKSSTKKSSKKGGGKRDEGGLIAGIRRLMPGGMGGASGMSGLQALGGGGGGTGAEAGAAAAAPPAGGAGCTPSGGAAAPAAAGGGAGAGGTGALSALSGAGGGLGGLSKLGGLGGLGGRRKRHNLNRRLSSLFSGPSTNVGPSGVGASAGSDLPAAGVTKNGIGASTGPGGFGAGLDKDGATLSNPLNGGMKKFSWADLLSKLTGGGSTGSQP